MPVSIFIDTGIDFLVSYTGTVHCTQSFSRIYLLTNYTKHCIWFRIKLSGLGALTGRGLWELE